MPADLAFVQTLVAALENRGARILEAPTSAAPNPFRLSFELAGQPYRALVYVRRATPQHGEATDHGRPAGEWHTQMIFDDSTRGAGVRNQLAAVPGYITVLLGYAELEGQMVVVAWDPDRKAEYGYSRSLQVREAGLIEATQGGLAQQPVRRGQEVVVTFRPEFLPEYLTDFRRYHGAIEAPAVLEPEAPAPARGGRVVVVPPDFFGPRERRPGGPRAVRDVRFKAFITDHYSACAICGIQVASVLEAAHIIPVADERGSDHPSNGLRLCRNCHALFDAGLLLVRPDYTVEVSARFAAAAPADAATYRAYERLRLPELEAEYRPDPEKLAYVYEQRRG